MNGKVSGNDCAGVGIVRGSECWARRVLVAQRGLRKQRELDFEGWGVLSERCVVDWVLASEWSSGMAVASGSDSSRWEGDLEYSTIRASSFRTHIPGSAVVSFGRMGWGSSDWSESSTRLADRLGGLVTASVQVSR